MEVSLESIQAQIQCLVEKIENGNINVKPILTKTEAARYLGVSVFQISKMVSRKALPYFCPGGKIVYFKREDIDAWVLSNPVKSAEQVERAAQRIAHMAK